MGTEAGNNVENQFDLELILGQASNIKIKRTPLGFLPKATTTTTFSHDGLAEQLSHKIIIGSNGVPNKYAVLIGSDQEENLVRLITNKENNYFSLLFYHMLGAVTQINGILTLDDYARKISELSSNKKDFELQDMEMPRLNLDLPLEDFLYSLTNVWILLRN